jgi:C-terminal processing protease CtpA/Prc
LIPDPQRAERIAGDLQQFRDEAGKRGSPRPLDETVLRQVESVCHRTARHLTLERRPAAEPDIDLVGWPPVPRAVVRRRAGFVRRVERSDDGVGLIRLDGFDDVASAGEYLLGAFALMRGAEGLIVDLRRNGGGALSTLTLVAEFILGTGIEQLSTVRYRDRSERQWWTAGTLGDLSVPPDRPVAVLVGPETYSSGEALAYHLQTRGRVRVFGERTPGAADHVTPIRVAPTVVALIPEATPADVVSGTNWEGSGVTPDQACPQVDAEIAARTWLDGRS